MMMEQLIPIASKLQDVLGALGQTTSLDLPQIVVVGGQSSGKSSVLESLVGRSFLPRGPGIVTRRPLILQLFKTSQTSAKEPDENEPLTEVKATSGRTGEDWGEFLHKPDQKYFDFAAIRAEIEAETNRVTGNKGIDPNPINLKIFSPSVLALTLVDLPGTAKVPVGDQPHDIERQIHDMCVKYTSNPNAIILAVTSANTDLANSDALKLAQTIDPAGERTIRVLTKLDLMDPGTDCADILMNTVIPLRRGYVAVVNRGQKDVKSDLSIRDGLKKEEHFFRKHPVYSRDRSLLTKCGTTRLSKTLNAMLMHHIRDCLPELKNRITRMNGDVQKELEALGNPNHGTSRSARGGFLLNLLSKFATNFAMILEGRAENLDAQTSNPGLSGRTGGHIGRTELVGGARISYVFNDVFAYSLNGVGAFDGMTDDEIRTTIANANGTRPALFVPEISFDILVRRQLARLEQPGIQAVDMVFAELQRISAQSEPNELTRFPILRDRMIEVVSALLRRCVAPTQMMVANLVKIELAYINTSHPDFIGGSKAVAQLMEKISKENDREKNAQRAAEEAVGATPLSSSSLNNYGYDGHDKEVALTPDKNSANGGLMNFIFRGNTPAETKPRTRAVPGGAAGGGAAGGGRGTGVEAGATSKNTPLRNPPIASLPQIPETMRQTDFAPTEREAVEMEVIKSLVESYFAIVRKNFIDMVPKTIMYFLVNHVKDSLQNELVSELYREAEMGQLLQEADDIAVRRQTCMEMKDLLGKALEIVNEVRDFNSFK